MTVNHSSEDLKREPLFFNDNNKGGTMYTFYERTVEQQWDNKSKKFVITKDATSQVGSMYVEPVPAPRHQNSFSVNIQIWGSGVDPEASYADKANPKAKIYTMDFNAFNAMLEPVLVGMDVKSPSDLKPPTISDIEQHWGEYLIGKGIEDLNKKWGEKPTSTSNRNSNYKPNSQYITNDPQANLPSGWGYVGKVLLQSVRTDSSGQVQDTITEYNNDYIGGWGTNSAAPPNDTTPTKKK